MEALTLKSIRLSTLVLGAALALVSPARAGDVSVKLDAGTGFSVKNSTGAIERLRVDEATGNISRNGALFVHTTGGLFSTFVGRSSGNASTTGERNSGFGNSALRDNTSGSYNSAFGQGALAYNTTGSNNSAFGQGALISNTTGTSNAAVGTFALAYNNTGQQNSALGRNALRVNTTGDNNSAVGYGALFFNDTGYSNSAFGASALNANTTGFGNSAVGYNALLSNTTGRDNSAVGSFALRNNTTGNFNSAFGRLALLNNTTGGSNSAFGFGALIRNTTGSRNVAVGEYAGAIQTTGSDNIYLANIGVTAESNTTRIGSVQTRAFVAGIRGVTTGAANAIPVLIDSAGQLGTTSSSRSVKNDIRDMGDATDRLLDLRPVTFRYKQQQMLPTGGEVPPEYGLIAEEVAEVFPDLVVYDEKGQPFTVKYHEMAPMLLNEMKKQRAIEEDQQRKIERQAGVIEAQQKEMGIERQKVHADERQIAALTTRLARIETRVGGAAGEAQR